MLKILLPRVKQGAAFSELKPPGRTLFLSNLPTWSTRAALKRLFQCNGPVEEVYLQRAPSAGDPPTQGPMFAPLSSFAIQ